MKYFKHKKLLFLFFFMFSIPVEADNLGRIFTSAEDRQKLEKIRNTKEKPKKVEEVKIAEKEVVKKEIIIRDPITLRGIVHRSGGKNTAWLNESNTIEGDLSSDVLQVTSQNIQADKVTVVMPEDNTNVELRVGEVYVPKPIERGINKLEDTR